MGRKPKNVNFALMCGFPLDGENRVIFLDIPFQDRTNAVPDHEDIMLRCIEAVFEQGPELEEEPN